jgi:glycosyltransferase involved in cell wall biosynthesis
MRIALVVHGWPAARMGGTGLYVEALANALTGSGHAVMIVHPGQPSPRHDRGAEPQDGQEPERTLALTERRPRTWEATWRHASMPLEALRNWRPDVVHIHHLSGLPLHLPRTARGWGARVVMTLHDYFLPCARGQLVDAGLRPCAGPQPARCARCLGTDLRLNAFTALAGRALAHLPSIRHRAQDHLGTFPAGSRQEALVSARLTAAQDATNAAHLLLSPSADLADRMAHLGWRRPQVLDLPLVRPIPVAPPPGRGPVRFLFASAVIPTKGPDRLLEAFAALPAGVATLTIAGPAPAFDASPDFAVNLRAAVEHTPHARWLGALPAAQIGGLLAEHDVLCLPSTWPENSPLIIREATAAGLRVLASGAGGAKELDPSLRMIPPQSSIATLTGLLDAEVALGRGRRAPLAWPNPDEHAARLFHDAYQTG